MLDYLLFSNPHKNDKDTCNHLVEMVNDNLSYGQLQITGINKAQCIELNWTISKSIKLIKERNINKCNISLYELKTKTQKS